MRAFALLLLLAGTTPGAESADDYFELGLDYLKKGFYARARAAFSESLVRAPGEPVPMALLAVAAAAEGRPAAEAATLLRWAHQRLPKDRDLAFDLRRLLPSDRALALLAGDYRRRLAATGPARPGETRTRRALLTVLAFLEVHDGDPVRAPALDLLLEEAPDDYAAALARRRPPSRRAGAGRGSSPTTPPTSSAPSGAGRSSWSDRS